MSEPLAEFKVGDPVQHKESGAVGVVDHVYTNAVEIVWLLKVLRPGGPSTIEWKKDMECLSH